MRLWLIHPKYLDCKGLVAVWREGLLAKKVLQGKTKGYVNHPQLAIFKDFEKSADLINAYLFQIYLEAKRRGYSFDFSKIEPFNLKEAVTITSEQLKEEFQVLLEKLRVRDKRKFEELKNFTLNKLEPNPVFRISHLSQSNQK
ncbi:MAG: pyrimidine dimer DNA glycosylase/endonuclease V [Candidatus Bathyarchaeia archaeon]